MRVAEYGTPAGRPVIYCHGSPGAWREAEAFDDAARETGVRIIAIDRPGIGMRALSSQGRVRGWGPIVAAVADALELEEFAVLGVSGGGPYALACAATLPGRVTAAAVVSSPAPMDEALRELDPAGRKKRRALVVLRRLPILVPLMAARLTKLIASQQGIDALVGQMCEPDRERVARDEELSAKLTANIREAFARGSDGFATDMRLVFTQPWGFALADVAVPVQIWHGTADTNVPACEARRLAAGLPHGRVHILPGVGHLAFVDYPEAILESLTS